MDVDEKLSDDETKIDTLFHVKCIAQLYSRGPKLYELPIWIGRLTHKCLIERTVDLWKNKASNDCTLRSAVYNALQYFRKWNLVYIVK